MRVSNFKIEDAPSQAGKVYLITGGTGGIGAQTVEALANHSSPPAHIYFTGRSESRAKEVIGRCPSADKVSFIKADLTSLAAVKQSAETFLTKSDRLDCLMSNAGIMDVPSGRTTEGYEIQFGTNHVGHALLFKLVQPTLSKAQDPRLVVLTSEAYQVARGTGIDLSKCKEDISGFMGVGLTNYGRSKFANLVYGQAVARHHPEIAVANLHPGIVATDLFSGMSWVKKALMLPIYPFTLSPKQGAFNNLHTATRPREELKSGAYYLPVGAETAVSGKALDQDEGERLWQWTEAELKPWLK